MKDPENPEVPEFGLNLAGDKTQFPVQSHRADNPGYSQLL
jgi:hypothetical protein